MNFELKIRNIVVIGAFNPMGFDRYFFVKNNIASEEQITDKSLFFPEHVQLITSRFHLTINGLQIVINSVKPVERDDEIGNVITKIMEHGAKFCRVSGSGINFNWFLKDESLTVYTKALCFNPSNKIQSVFFNEDDATFGFYSSKNIMDTRLKLDVKPMKYRQIGMDKDEAALQFEFNFHRDYTETENANELLKGILGKYKDFFAETEKIISSLK